MRLLLLIICAFMVVTGAESPCDPLTQYESDDGQCCKKCGPGTRMSSYSRCLDPQCQKCKDNEYQEAYTTKTTCDLQPYCDPNKNFEFVTRESKERRISCTCKLGYHCSSEACITCVPHTECGPGYRVQSKGNHTHDTVCQKCPPDTFSSGTSEDGDCTKRTVCGPESQVKTSGTATSDTVCEKSPGLRKPWVVFVCCLVLLVLIGGGIGLYKFRGYLRDANGMVKGCCVEEGTKKPETDANPTIANPKADPLSLTLEARPSQEEAGAKTPEENEDELNEEPSQPLILKDPVLTDNGNVVVQEDGKREVLSRQESQNTSDFL